MSNALLRSLNKRRAVSVVSKYLNVVSAVASLKLPSFRGYSRRSDSKKLDSAYKVVKSKVRIEEDADFLGVECGPNWELLAPRGNRFYFPNAVGPAWQGASTTIHLEAPLESLVDFETKVCR